MSTNCKQLKDRAPVINYLIIQNTDVQTIFIIVSLYEWDITMIKVV